MLFLGIDKVIWEFVNTFAPWLAAIGTLAAVVTSLYLAMRDRRIRLNVGAGVRKIATMGQTVDQGADVISIYVTNIGYRSATVTGLFWKCGVFKKTIFEIIPGNDFHSSTLPVKLVDGEEASYRIPQNLFLETNIKTFERRISRKYLKLRLKFMKIGVYTSIGKTFQFRIEEGLQDWFFNNLYRKK